MAAVMLLMFTEEERLLILGRVSSRVGRVKYNLMCKCLCLIIFFNRSMHLWNVEQQHLIATGLFINCTLQLLLVLLSPFFADAHYQFDCHFCIFLFSSQRKAEATFFCSFSEASASKYCQSLSQLRLCDWATDWAAPFSRQSSTCLVFSGLLHCAFCRYRKSLSAVICANLHGQWSQALTHTESDLSAD